MKFTSFDQSNLFADLDALDAWLVTRGITQRNRLRVYRENLIEMRDREKSLGPAEVYAQVQKAGRVTEILSSYVECFEIVDSINTLRAAGVEIPDELLKRTLDGPPDAIRESPKNNQGRNAMFELSIGATLARQHLAPVFNLGNPDIEFLYEDRCVLVECKRVLSEARTLPVLGEGVGQLKKQVNFERSDVGLVAVNISRMFYRGDGHWEAPEGSDVRLMLAEMIRSFIDRHISEIVRKGKPHAAGVLFYAASPFRLDGVGYIPVRTAVLVRLTEEHAPFLRRLASSIIL